MKKFGFALVVTTAMASGVGLVSAQSLGWRLVEGIASAMKSHATDTLEKKRMAGQQISGFGGIIAAPTTSPTGSVVWGDGDPASMASSSPVTTSSDWGAPSVEPSAGAATSPAATPTDVSIWGASSLASGFNAVGARQLFESPGLTAGGGSGFTPPGGSAPAGSASTAWTPAPSAPASGVNTGLMYYVELIQPGGAVSRVDASRGFRSGERIRLHFRSNVNGRVVIMQQSSGGQMQLLYPDRRVNGGDNRIQAGVDTVIPAGNAWLTFDNNPGVERLMVFLTTDAWYDAIPTGGRDSQRTQRFIDERFVQSASRSKSLILEVDDASAQPASYAVLPTSDSVYMEIVLNHQP